MNIYLVSNSEKLSKLPFNQISVEDSLSMLRDMNPIGLDTETSGLSHIDNDLLCVQFGNKEKQIVVDTTTVDIQLYKDLLEDESKLFLLWNAKFDLKFFFKHKIVLKKVWDGFLGEKLLHMGYPKGSYSASLQAAAEKYLNLYMDKSIRGNIIYMGLTKDAIEYAAKDVEFLEDIKNKQDILIKKEGIFRALDLENAAVIPIAYMEFCGVKLDKEKWLKKVKETEIEFDKTITDLDNWLIENHPEYTKLTIKGDLFDGFDTVRTSKINWKSSKQLGAFLESIGMNLTYKDPKDGKIKIKTDKNSIKKYEKTHSIVPFLLEFTKLQKQLSTYGYNVLEMVNPKTGRIYTNFNQLGTDTGRLSSGGSDTINMQNLPSDALTRSCFIAEEGNAWLSADYSGQESYLMASMANDEAMIHELTYGNKDIHSLVAKLCFPKEIGDTPISEIKHKFHDLRQKAKGPEFCFAYGGNDKTLVSQYGMEAEEAYNIYTNYMSGFKGLCKYQEDARANVVKNGYIIINELTGHKVFIHNHKHVLGLKNKQDKEYWDRYRKAKEEAKEGEKIPIIEEVRYVFKQISNWGKYSINYPMKLKFVSE